MRARDVPWAVMPLQRGCPAEQILHEGRLPRPSRGGPQGTAASPEPPAGVAGGRTGPATGTTPCLPVPAYGERGPPLAPRPPDRVWAYRAASTAKYIPCSLYKNASTTGRAVPEESDAGSGPACRRQAGQCSRGPSCSCSTAARAHPHQCVRAGSHAGQSQRTWVSSSWEQPQPGQLDVSCMYCGGPSNKFWESLRCHAMCTLEACCLATYGGLGDGFEGAACQAALRVAATEPEASLLWGLLAGALWTAARVHGRGSCTRCSGSVCSGTDHHLHLPGASSPAGGPRAGPTRTRRSSGPAGCPPRPRAPSPAPVLACGPRWPSRSPTRSGCASPGRCGVLGSREPGGLPNCPQDHGLEALEVPVRHRRGRHPVEG